MSTFRVDIRGRFVAADNKGWSRGIPCVNLEFVAQNPTGEHMRTYLTSRVKALHHAIRTHNESRIPLLVKDIFDQLRFMKRKGVLLVDVV